MRSACFPKGTDVQHMRKRSERFQIKPNHPGSLEWVLMKCDEKWREPACGDQNDLCDLRDRLVAEQYFETLRHAQVTLCAGKCPWFTGVSGHLRENRQCAH